jgi:hypothetical protein
MSADWQQTRGIAVARGAFAFKVQSLPYDELQVLRKKMEDLMASPGWDALMDLLDERHLNLLDALVHGSVLPHTSYAAQTGMVSGLDQARWAAQSVVDYAQEREREERESATEEADVV